MGAFKEIDTSAQDWVALNGWPPPITAESVIEHLKDYAQLAGPHELVSGQHYLINGKQLLIDIELAGQPLLALVWQDPERRRWQVVRLFEVADTEPANVVIRLGWERLPGSTEWKGALTPA